MGKSCGGEKKKMLKCREFYLSKKKWKQKDLTVFCSKDN